MKESCGRLTDISTLTDLLPIKVLSSPEADDLISFGTAREGQVATTLISS